MNPTARPDALEHARSVFLSLVLAEIDIYAVCVYCVQDGMPAATFAVAPKFLAGPKAELRTPGRQNVALCLAVRFVDQHTDCSTGVLGVQAALPSIAH